MPQITGKPSPLCEGGLRPAVGKASRNRRESMQTRPGRRAPAGLRRLAWFVAERFVEQAAGVGERGRAGLACRGRRFGVVRGRLWRGPRGRRRFAGPRGGGGGAAVD